MKPPLWCASEVTKRVWAVPVALGVLTATGLLAALLGTGAWRVLAWLALGAPLIVMARYAFLRR